MHNISKQNMMFSLVLLILVAVFGTSFLVSDFDVAANNIQGFAIGGPKEACIDTDGGIRRGLQGSVIFKDNNFITVNRRDICKWNYKSKTYTLVENYCEHGRAWNEEITCENGCYNGKCLESSKCIRTNMNARGIQRKNLGFFNYKDYIIKDNGDKILLRPFCEEGGDFIIPYCDMNTPSNANVKFLRKQCRHGCRPSVKTGEFFCGDG